MSKAVVIGAALAAAAGVMLGGAMQPQLALDGRPMGPQMFATGGGARATGPFDDSAAYANYRATIPTYVTGTDYIQAGYAEPAPIEPERQIAHNDVMEPEAPPPPAPLTRAAYDEPRLPEIVYPSVAGGTAYGAETPAPPPPPEDEAPTIVG